jgi:thiamine phosphate synthase YjbQ (UPF0047 family)
VSDNSSFYLSRGRSPCAAAEIQKLSSDRITNYIVDPVHPHPQYKHNTTQASIAAHLKEKLLHLKALAPKIDNGEV